MAKKEVTVVINGEEYVSVAAKEAATGMDGFFAKSKSWFSGFADLRGAWEMISGAVSKVSGAIMDSFAAYDELQNSQRKLEGTAKITGVSLQYLNSIASKGRDEFKLSRVVANDYAAEVAKLAVQSGDASKATDLLSAFLDLGAARGLTAAQSMQAASQSILGIDEGTDKLFGKNPSGLWADYAAATGKAAGKLTDMEKQAALVWATLNAGNATIGSYQTYLSSAQGQQEILTNKMHEFKASIGEAMLPLRAFVVDSLTGLTTQAANGATAVGVLSEAAVDLMSALRPIVAPIVAIGTVLAEVFGVGLSGIMLNIRKFAGTVTLAVGDTLKAFGIMVEKGGEFLKVFGIEVVAGAGKALREQGQSMIDETNNKMLRIEGDMIAYEARIDKIVTRWTSRTTDTVKKGADDQAKVVESGLKKTTGVTEGELDKQQKAYEKWVKDQKTAQDTLLKQIDALSVMSDTYRQTLDKLAKSVKPAFDKQHAASFNVTMINAADNADVLIAKIKETAALPPLTKNHAEQVSKLAGELATAARTTADVAAAFGVLDRDAASALTSVGNIADAIGKMAKNGLNFAGVSGLLGGVANIVSTMMAGDVERRRLLRDNNTALDNLRRDIGGLNLNISGEDFENARAALGGMDFGGSNFGMVNFLPALTAALQARGLTVGDLKRIGEEMGINIFDKDGKLVIAAVKQLSTALGMTNLGTLGQSFGDQLRFFRESQDITGATGITKISGLAEFLRNVGGVSALNGIDFTDPTKARGGLFNLFTSLNNGGVSAGALGKLTGGQLRDIILELIGGIDDLTEDSAPAGGDGATAGGGTSSLTGDSVSSDGVTFSLKDLDTTIKAMDTNVVTVLREHTAFHERIASATEGSYQRLTSIDTKMDTLIATTAGSVSRINRDLADVRLLALANAGRGPEF